MQSDINLMLIKFRKSSIVLFLIYYLNPFFDALTGYFVGNGLISENALFSPSQLFRLFLTIIILFFLRNEKKIQLFVYPLIYFIILELIAFLFHLYPKGLMSGLVSSYKLTFCILLYLLIKSYIDKKIISSIDLIKYFIGSATIYAIIILVSDLIGISFDVYGEGLGSKGVFASANGLGIFIGVASLFSLYSYLTKKNGGEFIRLLLFSYVLINLMSKAAIIMLLSLLLMTYYYLSRKYKCVIICIAACIFIFYLPIFLEIATTAITVIKYRYENAENLTHFLLSGRTEYLSTAFKQFTISGILMIRLLGGLGYFISFRNPYENNFWLESSSFLECELFDIFFMYGFIGILFYIFIILYVINKGFKLKGYKRIFLYAWIVLCVHSAFAGHVLFNGMSIIAFITTALVININKQNYNENIISIS